MNKPHHREPLSDSAKTSIAILALVLAFLLFLLWRQYVNFQRVQTIQNLRTQIGHDMGRISDLRSRGPLTADDASYIQSWMTFDYIDAAFNLPPDYLAQTLDINSPQYPRISIARYAREGGIDATMFSADVAAAVRTYVASSSPVSAN